MGKDELANKVDLILEQNKSMEVHINQLFEISKHIIEAVDNNFKVIDDKITDLESKIENLTEKVDLLQQSSAKEFKNVDGKLDEVNSALIDIKKVTNYDDMVQNMVPLSRVK